MKVLSLFSGIGAFEKALERCNLNYDLVNYCEIDKYASKSYSLIHNVSEDKNLIDVTKIDTSFLPKDIDLITYGFPCQDISQAGKQKGFMNENGELTRSGLFFEALRIISETKPKFAIAENVKVLTSKKFEKEFNIVLDSLNLAGYNNYYKVLNAKDYGVPQNRERVFIVSIRKDIDNSKFTFPEPFELELRLKDMLEAEVDEKYYLSDKQVNSLKTSSYTQNARRIQEKDWCDTLCARDWKDPKCVRISGGDKRIIQVGNIVNTGNFKNPQRGRIYNPSGIAPTLNAMQGGGLTPKIGDSMVFEGIRKLTPKECWRLMGFDDADIDKCIAAGISNSQLYKQAGNSIVVDVIEEIYCSLFNLFYGEIYETI